jgi:probable H4MPT-linked C1 transfer pathway protein
MPESVVLGWDIGGANIKAARVRAGAGTDLDVIELPFALWREPARLTEMLRRVADDLDYASTMAVTMTAELADCFATKREGVRFVLDAFQAAFPDAGTFVFGTDGHFRSLEAARDQPESIAAANWLAGAMLVARWFPDAVLLDVGSTTTDIIPIAGGRIAACGRTDTERLRSGALVYTGALRTPVAAIVRSVRLGGGTCRVAAEHFAIAADVHLWLGHIDERDYSCETPDGRGRSRAEAAARLARVVCADLERLSDDDITAIARSVERKQVHQVAAAIRRISRQFLPPGPHAAVIAGSGGFLARAAAGHAGLSVHDLAAALGSAASRAAPAAAVACLLLDEPVLLRA